MKIEAGTSIQHPGSISQNVTELWHSLQPPAAVFENWHSIIVSEASRWGEGSPVEVLCLFRRYTHTTSWHAKNSFTDNSVAHTRLISVIPIRISEIHTHVCTHLLYRSVFYFRILFSSSRLHFSHLFGTCWKALTCGMLSDVNCKIKVIRCN